MKLLYIANARIPTERAHGLHIVKMCEAIADFGVSLTLVLPQRKNSIKENLFSYYGIKKNFDVQYLPVADFVKNGFFGYWIGQLSFSLKLLFQKFNKNELVILTRDEWSGWILAKFGYKVFYDMHGFPETWLYFWKAAMKKMLGIICTNEWKMQQLFERFNIPKERVLLARNGFDPNEFNIDISKQVARRTLGLPQERPVVMYTGHLYDWKGVNVLAQAATYLEWATTVFVGGMMQDVKSFIKQHKECHNVIVLGHKLHHQIPIYLKAADVLVLPNSPKSKNPRAIPYSIYDTSPIKLFEYMASRRPIVASNLPSIREILNEYLAVFFQADNPDDLAQKINNVLNHKSEADDRANHAWKFVQKYTWKNRAQLILAFIRRL